MMLPPNVKRAHPSRGRQPCCLGLLPGVSPTDDPSEVYELNLPDDDPRHLD